MSSSRKQNLIQSRRRRQDEGEEEGSLTGELDNVSVSEGSALSIAEEDEPEGSEVSIEEDQPVSPANVNTSQHIPVQPTPQPAPLGKAFKITAATDAMLHGIKRSDVEEDDEVIHFEQGEPVDEVLLTRPAKSPPKGPRNETVAQRTRREHLEYIKQRDADPAFVPNRGGFFLHDNRASNIGVPPSWPAGRGRGRGSRPVLNGTPSNPGEVTEQQWVHDLHETVNASQQAVAQDSVTLAAGNAAVNPAQSSAPNRQFSFATTIGKISVLVSLPGMKSKVTVANVIKKQYTLLPQHRPPLRRDKPVRISIPDESPRYIFPSAERSFIFIPRALRPNQQSYVRGRGRGSLQGSRRTSLFGGSIYTPSMAMSRKSSIGPVNAGDGVLTSSEYSSIAGRPVVRMPSNINVAINLPAGPMFPFPPHVAEQIQQPATIRSPTAGLPMHQPRPQKAVSVAGIESPEAGALKAPDQQQGQPFHQQMPDIGSHLATPLAHIPEAAVYAQPFQPHSAVTGPGYFGAPFASNPMFYPPFQQGVHYGMPMAGLPPAPSFQNPASFAPMGFSPYPPAVSGQTGQPGALAHESNGMVFYYDPSQMSTNAYNGTPNMQIQPPGMNSSHFYYPVMTGMYPPTQAG